MGLRPRNVDEYYIFLASPNDMSLERQEVRRFFNEYNLHTTSGSGVRFSVVDWENYSTTGIGRPQQLITRQTLERYRDSLALVIGLMGQKFGSPTGTNKSGTEEEFEWALNSYLQSGFPEVKWFFRKVEPFVVPSADPNEIRAALEQWEKVQEFKKRLQQGRPRQRQPQLFYKEFADLDGFKEMLRQDLSLWLAAPE